MSTDTKVRQRKARGTAGERIKTRASKRDLFGTAKTDPSAVRDRIMDELQTTSRKYESNAIQDSFNGFYGLDGENTVEEPPYNPKALGALLDRSNMLRQCIDAYVANIEATGHTLIYIGPEGQEESEASLSEKSRVEALLEQPNGDYGLKELRKRNRVDYESIGWYGTEIIRDDTDEIVAYYNLPAHTLRYTQRDTLGTDVKEVVTRRGKELTITRSKRFRRIVQDIGGKKTYFKEFGDPRSIDPKSGKVSNDLELADQATEVLMVSQYRSGYTYGVPRYIHQLPSILGSREAELTNLQFFKDNAIPALAVLISGGSATRQTIEEVEDYFREGRGREAMNRVLFLEATGDERAADDSGKMPPPKMEIKPLSAERQNDATFAEYDKANMRKTRSAFRLNPMFTGESDDMTHATASSSLVMTEAQVFGPERNEVDDTYHLKILSDPKGRPPQFWKMRSNPPRIVNPKDVIESLSEFEATGAMTPNIAIAVANEAFGLEVERITEPWGDLPFSITKDFVRDFNIQGFEDLIKERRENTDKPETEPGTSETPDQDEVDKTIKETDTIAQDSPGDDKPTAISKDQKRDEHKHVSPKSVRQRSARGAVKVRQRTRT